MVLPLTVIEILSVCLRRPCVRFSICMTVHRSKCHLKTVRLFNTRYVGLVVRITVLRLCFYTPFNVKIPMPNCTKMHHLKWKSTKIFWGGGTGRTGKGSGEGRGIPRTQPPRHLRRLDARAFHGQLPRMCSDPRNAPGSDRSTCPSSLSLCNCYVKLTV